MAIRDTKESYNQYMRRYHLKRYYRMKQELINLLGGKCQKCESVEWLQFDHIDRKTKKINITNFLLRSLVKSKKELEKCQLLCRDCHREKSILEVGKKIARGTHGTLSSYRYCHCDLCKTAMSS